MLKEYEIQVDGKPHKVLIKERGASRLLVSVDGREVQVNCDGVPSFSKKFAAEIESVRYDVSLGALKGDGVVHVMVEGQGFSAAITGEREQRPDSPRIAAESKKKEAPETGIIHAPMSGRISSIAVLTGQTVHAGQTLLVLEAMKMENEIAAPRDGTVRQIHVSRGTKVSKNDPLITLA
jgi:biotin carboxyl carrier protein